jgi:hypothetical protein
VSRYAFTIHGPASRAEALAVVNKAPEGYRVEVKAAKRSLDQNAKMWACLTDWSRQVELAGRKRTPDEWKAVLLHAFGQEVKFLPSLDEQSFVPVGRQTSDLSKDEMSNFIEFIIAEGTKRGVTFQDAAERAA